MAKTRGTGSSYSCLNVGNVGQAPQPVLAGNGAIFRWPQLDLCYISRTRFYLWGVVPPENVYTYELHEEKVVGGRRAVALI